MFASCQSRAPVQLEGSCLGIVSSTVLPVVVAVGTVHLDRAIVYSVVPELSSTAFNRACPRPLIQDDGVCVCVFVCVCCCVCVV